jgi:2-C-methyl-D-erythritol 4-phosphate cytidylyltransferase
MNGVSFLNGKIRREDHIVIHYGAAPFTSPYILSDALRVCKEKGNAVCGIPCFQLMGTQDGGVSKKWVDRDLYVQITCPYCFRFGFVQDLYQEAREKDLLDKVEPHITTLMQYLGYELYLSYGDQTNLKITTQEDLTLFEGYALAQQRQNSLTR